MELNEFRIFCKRKSGFRLRPMGDFHKGVRACDEKALQIDIDEVVRDPNCYVIGMGDYADFINYTDPRFDPQTLSSWLETKNLSKLAEVQASKVTELLSPIAKAGRLIGLLEGNHENTIKKKYSYHVAEQICNSLGVKFLTYAALTRLTVQDTSKNGGSDVIRVFSEHGTGGGRYTGAKLNNVQMDGRWIDAEIYLRGHVHEKVASINPCLSITRTGPVKWVEKPRAFILTGSYLRTYHYDPENPHSTYAEKMSYPATAIGSPLIHVRFDPYQITVTT